VDRREEGITFAQITIPTAIKAKPDERDQVEQDFLKQRELEMQQRYQRTLKRLKK